MNVKLIAILLCLLSTKSQRTSSLPTLDKEPNDVNNINDRLLSVGQRLLQDEEQRRVIDVQRKNSRPEGCPSHFTYLPSVRGCYKVVTDLLPWETAGLRCTTLNKNAHLLIVTSAAEQRDVVEELVKWYSGCDLGMWTAGQRANPGTPYSEFVWKIVNGFDCPRMFEMTYKHWGGGDPSSNESGAESCMHLYSKDRYTWYNWECRHPMCAVCEIDM